jgi:hypothetical protein
LTAKEISDKKNSMRLKLLLLLSFFILINSCKAKEAEKNSTQEADSKENNTSIEAPILTLTKNQSDSENDNLTEPQDSDSETAQEIVWDPFSGPLHLQSIKPTAYLLPESLMIGSLSDPLSHTLAEREAYSLVTKFWEIFRKGRVPGELLSKTAHPLFMEEMEEYLDKGSEVIALYPGSFRLMGSSASMKLVLLSESGYLKAVMYMNNENDVWLLEDWEIPFRNWPGEAVPLEKDLLQRRTVY